MGENVSDYSRFDFRALWKGRDRVTEVEREIVRRALATADRRRVLEVGTGFGRLLGTLAEIGDEVVATDFDHRTLGALPEDLGRTAPLRVAANLYHLPFVSGAFSSASMVRVYHHLSDPRAALAELGRVLTGGARALLSYNPKPSVGTFVNDIQRAIHPVTSGRFRSITFARGSVELEPDPFPVYVADRSSFDRHVRAAGFRPRGEVVSGLEEYYLMRFVPAELFLRIAAAFGNAPLFPMRFALLETPGSPAARLPPLDAILACPKCRGAIDFPSREGPLVCGACGFAGRREGPVIDLRYVPEGTRRWEAAG